MKEKGTPHGPGSDLIQSFEGGAEVAIALKLLCVDVFNTPRGRMREGDMLPPTRSAEKNYSCDAIQHEHTIPRLFVNTKWVNIYSGGYLSLSIAYKGEGKALTYTQHVAMVWEAQKPILW